MINTDVVADHTGFTDDDTGAVIDEKTAADFGPRVNVDARIGVSYFGDDTGQQRKSKGEQGVGQAVIDDARMPG